MARLLIWQGNRVERSISLYKPSLLIGRSSQCDIQLDDLAVSRKHARLQRLDGLYFIEDLDSRGGVHVNRQKVERVQLRDGDHIVIPPYQLQFVIDVEAEARSAQCVVELESVSKDYPLGSQRVHALSEVSLTVYQGEFSALAGPSGSGKSTLLNLIGCIDTPTSGRVRILGQDVAGKSPDELADLRLNTLGFVFQTFNLLPVLTAWENVEYPLLQKHDISADECRRRVRHYLQVVGLERYAGHRPNEMSGGQRQRVAIARALATQPKIILADEPTANLDRKTGEEILQLMRQLNRDEGITFIFSTHDPRVIEMADRVYELSDGRLMS